MRAATDMRSDFTRSGKPEPSAFSWCCASTSMAPGRMPMRRPWATPWRDMVAVRRHVFLAHALIEMPHAFGQVELAHVVQQRTGAQVEHLVVAQPEDAAHQQGNDGHVHRMRAGSVARVAAEQTDAHVTIDQHLVQQRARQVLGVPAGLLRFGDHPVLRATPGLASLVELALAKLRGGAVRRELIATLAFGSLRRRFLRSLRPRHRPATAHRRRRLAPAGAPVRSFRGSSAAASGPGCGSCRSAARA